MTAPVVVALTPGTGREHRQPPLPLQWALPSGAPALPRLDDVVARRPDAASWSTGLVQSVLEVLSGDRPPQQVMRWLDTPVYDGLHRLLATRPRRGAAGTVRSVHVCLLEGDVAEVSVVVGLGPRARAVALRLEGVGNRWRCTSLAIL